MSHNRQDARDQELLKRLQKKLDYEMERNALVLRVQELGRKIVEEQAEYGAIYNERAPLLNLPMEVTCIIFDYAAGYPREGGQHLLLEVVVSHVCHQWRSISLAYPRLWAGFCYDGSQNTRIPLDRLDAYLKRSRSNDLELWLKFMGSDPKWSADQLNLLVKTIPHVARWKRVTVISDWNTPVFDLLPMIESIFAPKLEHFAFRPSLQEEVDEASPISSLEPTVFTMGAPKIKSVVLDCSSFACLPPLSNISTLRLESQAGISNDPYVSRSIFLAMLSISTLENLSLVGDVFYRPNFHSTGLIVMNNLKHLRYCDNDTMSLLLPFLRAPLLETLIIQNSFISEKFETLAGNLQPEPYIFPSLRSLSLIETTANTWQVALRFAQMTESVTKILFSQEDSEEAFGESLFSLLSIYTVTQQRHLQDRSWTKVTSITCNLVGIDDVLNFFNFVQPHGYNVILRIFEHVDDYWKENFSSQYAIISKVYSLERMERGRDSLSPICWPTGEYDPRQYRYPHQDHFYIDVFRRRAS